MRDTTAAPEAHSTDDEAFESVYLPRVPRVAHAFDNKAHFQNVACYAGGSRYLSYPTAWMETVGRVVVALDTLEMRSISIACRVGSKNLHPTVRCPRGSDKYHHPQQLRCRCLTAVMSHGFRTGISREATENLPPLSNTDM